MSGKLRVHAFSVSIDGFGAGPAQSLEDPMGQGGMALHDWVFGTQTFRQRVLRLEGGSIGIDDRFAAASFEGIGAWILGRNMFGPVRGPWPDEAWRGWWGEDTPFGVPVYVLTRHARPSFETRNGTVFHFVTDGIESALERARTAALGQDVRLGGGVATLRQYLRARLVDEMHLAVGPVLLGRGEALFDGLDLAALGYRVSERVCSEAATHLVITRDKGAAP